MLTAPSNDKPGSREEQVKDGGMDFIGNRRTGTNSASDFTYSYPTENRSKPKTISPPARPPPGVSPRKAARAFNATRSTARKTAEVRTRCWQEAGRRQAGGRLAASMAVQ